MMIFGTPTVLLLEHLGASTFMVGLSTSFVFVLYPLQVLATASLSRLGFQRQMVLAWILRALFLLVPLFLAIRAPQQPEPWMAMAVVLSIFLFCFFRAFGVAAHVPWFAGILPDALRGRFFATEAAVTSSVGVVALLSCAGLFATLPPWQAFRAVYAIALFGSLMATLSLTRMPAGPPPEPSPIRQMGAETLGLCLGRGLFRQYLILTGVGGVVFSSFTAFTIYYLKSEAGLASSQILGFTAAQFGGQIVGSWGIRLFLDRVLIRRFFQFAQSVLAVVFAYWLGIVRGEVGWLVAVPVSYFVVGVALGVSNSAHVTFLPELSPAAKRPVSIAVFGALSGTLQGLGPIFWGLALRTGPLTPGVDATSFAIFFALGILLCGVSFWLLASLPDTRAGMGGAQTP